MKKDSILKRAKDSIKNNIGPIVFGVFGIGSALSLLTWTITRVYELSPLAYEITNKRILLKYGDINKDGIISRGEEDSFYKRLSERLLQKGFVLSEHVQSKAYGNLYRIIVQGRDRSILEATDLERLTEDFFRE